MNKLLPIRIGNYHGYILQAYATPSLHEALTKLFLSGFTSLKAVSCYSDREVYRLPIHSRNVENSGRFGEIYVKRYYVTTLKQKLQALFCAHKAQKSWRIGQLLLKKDILTPQPVAYLTHQTLFFSGERIVITAGVPNGISLHDYVRTYIQERAELPHRKAKLCEKRELMRSVAEFLAKLHLNGVYHGDFTAGNIFLERLRNTKVRFRIYLIDLDSVRSTFWIPSRRRIKNLDELGRNFLNLRVFSTSDRVRFLKHYFKMYPKETRTFRQLFYEVFQRTQFRLKKHHQQFK